MVTGSETRSSVGATQIVPHPPGQPFVLPQAYCPSGGQGGGVHTGHGRIASVGVGDDGGAIALTEGTEKTKRKNAIKRALCTSCSSRSCVFESV